MSRRTAVRARGIIARKASVVIRDSHYRDKQRFRGRGVADLVARVGDVESEIDRRLARGGPVRVLDLGCGYGTVLLEWRRRYGARVELSGLNRQPQDGDDAIVRRNGIERGLVVAEDGAAQPPMPTLAFADAAQGLPFADASIDLVVSQVAWLYFGNKVGVLRETMRILKDDGVAYIDADEIHPRLPAEYARLVEIWQRGRLVPLGEYLGRFGGGFVPAAEGECLRIGKSAGLGDDLERVCEIDVSTINADWDGIKCVYRMTP
jgi:SAM-dependent methyltransferase